MTPSEASDDMLEGYRDGFAGCPDPGGNRSLSYRHGWRNGRDDRLKSPRATSDYIRAEADAAVEADCNQNWPH